MTKRQLLQEAKAILQRIHYGVIASVNPDGTPWNTPVVMLPDAGLTLYWFSDQAAQHSRNLQTQPQVFITIFDSTVPVFSQRIDRALYIEAIAAVVQDAAEIEHAYALLGRPSKHRPSTQRVYCASPQRAWINDVERGETGINRDIRHELPLDQF